MLKESKKNARRSARKNAAAGYGLLLSTLLLPVGLSVLLTLFVLLLTAALLMRTEDPAGFHAALPVGLMLLSSLAAGSLSALCNRRAHPLVAALPVGLVLMLLLWLCSLFTSDSTPLPPLATLGLRALTPVCAVLGAMAVGYRKRRAGRHRRHRR